jgi:hypothetical protein
MRAILSDIHANPEACTPLFSVSTVSHGRLHWNFVDLEPILSRLRAKRITDRAMLEVRQAIGERQALALLV